MSLFLATDGDERALVVIFPHFLNFLNSTHPLVSMTCVNVKDGVENKELIKKNVAMMASRSVQAKMAHSNCIPLRLPLQ